MKPNAKDRLLQFRAFQSHTDTGEAVLPLVKAVDIHFTPLFETLDVRDPRDFQGTARLVGN